MSNPAKLLAAHDEQARGTIATRLPSNWKPEWDGPLLRVTTPVRGFAFARDIDALSVDELDTSSSDCGTSSWREARRSSGRRTATTVPT